MRTCRDKEAYNPPYFYHSQTTMNMKTKILLIALSLGVTIANAQSLGEFKPKDQKYGINKAKKADKIFISSFSVNYQVYNEKESFKQGGSMLGGGYKGDAKAELSVGMTGLNESDVQSITDKLYQDYVAQLKEKGFEIISADAAENTATYADYVRLKGGTVSKAQFPGTMSSSPTGYEYFVKKITSKGKAKSGGFLNNPAMLYPKLSKDLGDAVVASVDIFVMFIEDKNAFKGAGANIKVKTNLRIADVESIIMTSDASFKLKGQNQYVPISSAVSFYHGKMGLASTTSYVGTLGKPLEINDVIEDTKLQSFAKNSQDVLGTSMGMYRVFNPDNTESKSTKIISVDSKKYVDGVYMGAKQFMDYHTKAFLNDLRN